MKVLFPLGDGLGDYPMELKDYGIIITQTGVLLDGMAKSGLTERHMKVEVTQEDFKRIMAAAHAAWD